MKGANSENLPAGLSYDLNLADIAELWRRGSVISSWLLDLTSIALASDGKLDAYSGHVEDSGEGRWTIQAALEEGVSAEVAFNSALYPVPLAPGSYLRRKGPLRHAQGIRRPRRTSACR